MKKLTLLTCAFVASTMAFAQTTPQKNLALNKTVTASSTSNEGTLEGAVDGNIGTKWASVYQDKTDEERNAQWICVDLGSSQKINYIKMLVDNQPAKNFDIRIASSATNMNDMTTAGEVVLENQSSKENVYNPYKFEKEQDGQYVIIHFKERAVGNQWGYGISELEVYNKDFNNIVLGSFTLPVSAKWDANGTTVAATVKDTYNDDFTSDVTYTISEGATITNNGNNLTITATQAGTYTITATDGKVTLKQDINLLDPKLINKFEIPGVALYNEDGTTVSIKLTNPFDEILSPNDYTFTVSDGATVTYANNALTIKADKAGTYIISVSPSDGDEQHKDSISIIGSTADDPNESSTNVHAIFSKHYEAEQVDEVMNNAWESRFSSKEMIALTDDDDVYFVEGAGSFGLRKGTPKISDYKSLKFDIYTFEDIVGTVELRNSSSFQEKILSPQEIMLKKGQWNHVEVSLDAVKEADKDATIGWVIWTCTTKGLHNLIIDNVYLSKEDAEANEAIIIVDKTSTTERALDGKANSADEVNKVMNESNVTLYDLTSLQLDATITKIEPVNKNALIYVTEDMASNLTETKNLVTTVVANAYAIAPNGIELTDGDPVYTAGYIDTKDKGYTYTRTIESGQVVTTYLPCAVNELPNGLCAYKIGTEGDKTITFTKQEAITAETPYLLYAYGDNDVTFNVTGTGQLNLTKGHDNKTDKAEKGTITFHGNYETKSGTGNEYGLQGATKDNLTFRKVESGATIGAFRAYFTTIEEGSDAKEISIVFDNGNETTGINSLDTEMVSKLFNVYSLDGKVVRKNADSVINLPKGIYIINGKKMVVK